MEDNVFAEAYARAASLLRVEEAGIGAMGREDITAHKMRREDINTAIVECGNALTRLTTRYHHLPELPDQYVMDWASAVLAMPNLRILVLDTTGVDDEADIIRLLVMDREGNVTFDHLVYPSRHALPAAANTPYTGIDSLKLIEESLHLDTIWHNFSEAVQGHYVISYNLEFTSKHLAENAKHHGLKPLFLIGDDLQEMARRFFEPSRCYPLKLSVCCERIGYGLDSPPSAFDRAQAQIAVLCAMADGLTSVAPAKEIEEAEDEGGPF